VRFTAEQNTALAAPLDPKYVRKPSGSFGPKGDYLEGWHVINELNRVFGFDGWSYTVDLTRDALEEDDGKGQWQAAYTCICTLTVGDVKRQDVGFGSGFAKQIGDAIEGATKEATTDALKRCARTFGNVFGLALYDKSRANVQAAPEPLPASVQAMMDGLAGAFDNGAAAMAAYWTQHWPAVPAEHRPRVLAFKEELKARDTNVSFLRAG